MSATPRLRYWPNLERRWWKWARWLPHFVRSGEQPPDVREAWWGPFNVRLLRVGAVTWPTHFKRTLCVDIRLPFGFQFVFMLYHRWPRRPKPVNVSGE